MVAGRAVAVVPRPGPAHDGRVLVATAMGALPDAGATPEAGLALVALEVVASSPVALAFAMAHTGPTAPHVEATAGAARATGAGRGAVVNLVTKGGHGRRPPYPADVRQTVAGARPGVAGTAYGSRVRAHGLGPGTAYPSQTGRYSEFVLLFRIRGGAATRNVSGRPGIETHAPNYQ